MSWPDWPMTHGCDTKAKPMATSSINVNELMEEASEHLAATRYFAAERVCEQALRSARQECDFDTMSRICLPLQEARRQRLQQAVDTKKLTVVEAPFGDDYRIRSGCYLVQPPLVGADARRLRTMAISREIPVLVVCREPVTRAKLTPIVAIGQTTIRVRIDSPAHIDKPTIEWLERAAEQLGDAAILGVDTGIEAERQVDALLACLDAHPDHEKLHQALATACRKAADEARANPGGSKRRSEKIDPEESDVADDLG